MDQICPKGVFPVYHRKGEHDRWVLHIRISLDTKFKLKLTILIFWTKFSQKQCFRSKTEKVNTTNEFYIFELVKITNFSLNCQFWFFGPNLPEKGNSVWKQNLIEYHHCILPIRISVGNKFRLNLTTFIFWTKFAQKEEFGSETERKWTLPLNSGFKMERFHLCVRPWWLLTMLKFFAREPTEVVGNRPAQDTSQGKFFP